MSTLGTELKPVEVRTTGFADGINMQYAPNELAPTEVRRAENGFLDERGGFTKRLGCQNMGPVGASGDRIISCYTFYRGDALQPQFLIHTTAGSVYYTTDPTVQPTVWNLISTAGSFSKTQPMSWETYSGMVFFCAGLAPMSSWDGSTYTTYPSAPNGKYLRLWKDALWVSGVANYPDRVYSSAAGDATTWPVANWVDIRHGDGDAIRALASVDIYLLVGKRYTGSVISDPATYVNHVFDYEKGIESHWSVVNHEAGVFWVTRRGIGKWEGDSPSSMLSYKVDPLFDPHIINFDRLQFAWAYTDGQRVSWAIPEIGQTYPTLQVNYHPRLAMLTALGIRGLGPWSLDRIPMICAMQYRWQTTLRLFGGASGDNAMYWIFADNAGTDDGVGFSATLETAAYDFGAPVNEKYIRRMRVLGRGKLHVQLKRNFEASAYKTFGVDLTSPSSNYWNDGVWDPTTQWGPDNNIKEATVNPDAYGRYFSVVITDSDTAVGTYFVPVGSKDYSMPSGQWSILGIVLDGWLLGVRELK
jgi:hypothetical protein